jgi:hypothetical protein
MEIYDMHHGHLSVLATRPERSQEDGNQKWKTTRMGSMWRNAALLSAHCKYTLKLCSKFRWWTTHHYKSKVKNHTHAQNRVLAPPFHYNSSWVNCWFPFHHFTDHWGWNFEQPTQFRERASTGVLNQLGDELNFWATFFVSTGLFISWCPGIESNSSCKNKRYRNSVSPSWSRMISTDRSVTGQHHWNQRLLQTQVSLSPCSDIVSVRLGWWTPSRT